MTKKSTLVKRLKEMRDSEGMIRISPALAEEITEFNYDNYRPVIPSKVLENSLLITNSNFVAMPSDHITIQLGRYTLEHGPHKGKTVLVLLINGQHRLYGCIKAGMAIDVYLTFCDVNVGQKALPYMDGGTLRTAAQFIARKFSLPLSIANPAASISRLRHVHQQYAGTKPRGGRKISVAEIFTEFTRKGNTTAILAAVDITNGAHSRKGFGKLLGVNAAYKTALAKGLTMFPKKRMNEFHAQFCLGQCSDPKTDKSAELLSKYYAVNFANHRGGGELPTHEYYKRCEWAVKAFGDKEYVVEMGTADRAGDYLPL